MAKTKTTWVSFYFSNEGRMYDKASWERFVKKYFQTYSGYKSLSEVVKKFKKARLTPQACNRIAFGFEKHYLGITLGKWAKQNGMDLNVT